MADVPMPMEEGMTQQHITQEQATQMAAHFFEGAMYEFNIANAAIQHYLDQRKAELPVLPEPYFGSGRYLGEAGSRDAYTTTQIQTYGAACAAQARKLALEEAKEAIESANARRILYVPDCIDVIEALKGK